MPIHQDAAARLDVVAPGWAPARRDVPRLNRDATVSIELVRAVVTAVRVVDAGDGAPVAGARIHAIAPFQAPVLDSNVQLGTHTVQLAGWNATTDARGEANLEHLSPGFHHLLVDAPGRRWTKVDFAELPPVPSPLTIALEGGHAFEVMVRDADGRPLRGQELILTSIGTDVAWTANADEEGIVVSPGYPAGARVDIAVVRSDLDPVAKLMASFFPVRTTVVVPVAERVELVIPQRRSRVRASWTPPAEREQLTVSLLRLQNGEAEAGPVEVRTVDASAGELVLAAFGDGKPHMVQAVGERTGVWRSEACIPDPTAVTSVTVTQRVPRSGIVYARATSDGQPVAGARVVLRSTAASLPLLGCAPDPAMRFEADAIADDAGMAVFDGLLPADYVLEARTACGSSGRAEVRVDGAVAVEVVLATPGRVTGRIEPASSRRVGVTLQEARGPMRYDTLAGPDGTFDLDLPAGDYRASARDLDARAAAAVPLEPHTVPVRVTSGATAELVLHLPLHSRDVEIRVRGVAENESIEVWCERMNPYDRVGRTVARAVRPVTRQGIARFGRLETDAAFGITAVRKRDRRLLGWGSLPRGTSDSLVIAVEPGVMVRVGGVEQPAMLRLVPLHADGVLLRGAAIAPAATASRMGLFEGVQSGRYRLCLADERHGVGRAQPGLDVDIGAAQVELDWSAAR